MSVTYAESVADEAGQNDFSEFEELAEIFSQRTLAPIFENESSDGDLSQVAHVFQKALEAGLAFSPDPDAAGFDYGIWGGLREAGSVTRSLVLLSKIAETCGGFAALLHWQGLASNVARHFLNKREGREWDYERFINKTAICFQEDWGLPSFATLQNPTQDAPAQILCEAVPEGDNYILNGHKSFVYAVPDVESCLVFARLNQEWGCFWVPLDGDGVKSSEPGQRSGLRACSMQRYEFHNVQVPGEAALLGESAALMLRESIYLNWIGLAAISCGIARNGVKRAKTYAGERYQGGDMIENHPIIKMLLADAEADAEAARALVFSIRNVGDIKDLKRAAMVKLKCLEFSARAVTNSLQVFGGYGYMEDFGMEKKLRDVSVLKSSYGSPNFLKQFIHDCGKHI